MADTDRPKGLGRLRRRPSEEERHASRERTNTLLSLAREGPVHGRDPDLGPLLTPVTAFRDGQTLAQSVALEHLVEAPKRAGRNLVLATTVGLAILALTLWSANFHPMMFGILLYTVVIISYFEWRQALQRQRRSIPLVPIISSTIGMGVATWYMDAEGLVVALLVACAGVVAWRLVDDRMERTMEDSLASILTLMWIPFLASFLLLMVTATDGWQRIWVFFFAVVGADTGALFAGMRFGKRKLAPTISPSKTWEGVYGGVALGAIAATIAAYFLFDGRWWIGAIVAPAVAFAAIVGDLAESALKRDIRIKDMSQAVPGHGGVLDRLDSVLVSAPIAYVLFAIILGSS